MYHELRKQGTSAASHIHPEIVFVVAVAENGVIGHNNGLPWRLKSDLQRFKALTVGKPVIMGRKTFASIGRPLPGRTNIVVTRNPDFQAPQIIVAQSLERAHEIALGDALRRFATEIMVIGGAEIFSQWLDRADRLEITKVHASPVGDASLPEFDPAPWEIVSRVEHAAAPGDSADVSYLTYRRRVNPVG